MEDLALKAHQNREEDFGEDYVLCDACENRTFRWSRGNGFDVGRCESRFCDHMIWTNSG